MTDWTGNATDQVSNRTETAEAAESLLTRRDFLRLSVGGVTVAAVVLAAGGCGGGSNGGGNRNRVEVVLAWPERQPAGQSRYIPPYALSVVLELSPKTTPNDANEKHSQTVNRPDGDVAVTQTVYFDQELKTGTYVLTGEARTQKDSAGTTVARAQMECEVRRNETARPELTLESSIAQVEILGRPLELLVGEQQSLTGHALDAAGQVIFLPDGALVYQQVSGAEQMSVTPEGRLTGLARGVARVRLIEPQINHSDEADVTVRNYTDGLAAAPWPKLGSDLLNSGRAISGSEAIGVKKWTFSRTGDASSYASSSPVVGVDGTVYIGGGDDLIFAIDGVTGDQKWRYGTAHRSFETSTPAIGSNGLLYVGMKEAMIALDAATGAKTWEFGTGASFSDPSLGADGTVYVGGVDRLYALNGTTGQKKWEFRTASRVRTCSAIAPDGTVYFASYLDGTLYALDGRIGAKKWEFRAGNAVLTSPAIGADGTIYFGSYDRNVYALDGETGAKKWEFRTAGAVESSPAIGSDGTVYIGGFVGHVFALDGATGAKKWEFLMSTCCSGEGSMPFIRTAPVIGAGGTVYIGSSNGRLYALDAATGTSKWEHRPAGSVSMAIGADGTVYGANSVTEVYAIR